MWRLSFQICRCMAQIIFDLCRKKRYMLATNLKYSKSADEFKSKIREWSPFVSQCNPKTYISCVGFI